MYLHNDIKEHFATTPLFDQMMALKGTCFRQQKGRITQQIMLGEQRYFIKQHFGVGWKEIFKNILQLRWPIISAKNEWLAIHKLQSLGIDVPKVVAYGERGSNPARVQSFIMMEELTPVFSLEQLCQTWSTFPPAFSLKRRLIEQVAHIASVLHQNGINHRDFYLCHFLLETTKNSNGKLYLIDLHRAQIRALTPRRWVIKDLAGLYFSSKEFGLTQRDLYRFIKRYDRRSLREIIATNDGFWRRVKRRGEKLYRDLSQ